MLSIKAASSIRSNDTASDLAASAFDDLAVILDPFFNLKDNLFFSTAGSFNHLGSSSYINIVLETKLRAVAWVVAKANTFLSL